jgi:ubiquinone/menaquinone biosynthesis C-methylase UbiE
MSACFESRYVLGHSRHEMDRLALQALVLRPITERLLRSAGLSEGMRVLDLGCGVGDVSMLAAEIVGRSGSVVGIDRSADALARASDRKSALSVRNIEYQQGDISDLRLPASFDAVIGRYILIHMADPATTLRHVSGFVRPSGLLAFHEIDLTTLPRSHPPVAEWDRACSWVMETFKKILAHPDAALRMTEHFARADLPPPTLFCETPIGNRAHSLNCRWTVDTVLTLKSKMLEFGLADAVYLDEQLADRIHDATCRLDAQLVGPAQICAWTRLH